MKRAACASGRHPACWRPVGDFYPPLRKRFGMITYEYWQHRETGAVWAVKVTDEQVIGATQIGRQDVHTELLPHLAYRTDEVD